MENKEFLQAIELVNKNLIDKSIDQAFNSIGSNVFFEFGKLKEVEFTNGEKGLQREWSIWLNHVSWRITKNNKYFIGSGEKLDINIQQHFQKLLGKRFQSISFLSQFLDIEFNFEDGYQIRTFFNWMEENQWTIFLPDDSYIGVDCSSESALKNVQNIASQLCITEHYEKLNTPIQEGVISEITFNYKNLPVFHFKENFSLSLESCVWRLEKDGLYVIGCLDEDLEKMKNELRLLIGKKLKQINIANPMMDARIQWEDGFVLKTFSCCHIEEQWKIYKEKKPVFCASIPLLEIAL